MIDVTILYIVIVLIIIINILERHNATKREDDLLNRLMARDFNAYVQGVKALKKEPEKVEPITLSDLMEKEDKGILPVD